MKNYILVPIIIGILCLGFGFGIGYFVFDNPTIDNCEGIKPEEKNNNSNFLDTLVFTDNVPEEVLTILGITNNENEFTSSNLGFNHSLNHCYLNNESDMNACIAEAIVTNYGTKSELQEDGSYTYTMDKNDLKSYIDAYKLNETDFTYNKDGIAEYNLHIMVGGYFATIKHNFVITITDDVYEIMDFQATINDVDGDLDGINIVNYIISNNDGIYTLESVY